MSVPAKQQAAAAWNELANYFNQYLAERFPFANGVQVHDADPARVQHFLDLIDKRLPVAQAGSPLNQTPERLAAEDFLNRLKQASTWLTPLFVRDKSGILGVELDVRWRTDREDEQGADQVIAWGLSPAINRSTTRQAEQPNLRWMVGQPIRLTLRWAEMASNARSTTARNRTWWCAISKPVGSTAGHGHCCG